MPNKNKNDERKKQVRKFNEASDKPIDALVEHAKQAVKGWQERAHMTPRVLFKHTCGECGQRGFIATPNTVPKQVTCENCGHTEPYYKGGYSLAFELEGVQPHGYSTQPAEAITTVKNSVPFMVQKSAPTLTDGIPVKIGARLNPDQSVTAIDRDALGQFVAACEAQGMKAGA